MAVMVETELGELRQTLGLTRESLAAILGVSSRTVARWEYGQGEPSQTVAAKVRQLHQCAESLKAAIKADQIPRWLNLPNKALGGKSPREALLEEGGIERVQRIAGWLEWGIPG
jgi:DNA-binding XRE family transcriptional regulator